MFLELVGLFDASRNATGHVQTPESEVTGMNKLFTEWAKSKKAGNPGEYHDLVVAAVRLRPHWAPDVEHMVAFLGVHAGGFEGKYWDKSKSLTLT